ncbi:MAG: hypothetical protein RLZZ28_2439, partial [Bacteroidota bacterium]
ITGLPADSLKFKVPSLRNVAVSFPYGHDGRFFSIKAVLEHYRSTVQYSATVDPSMQNRLPLSNFEIGQLTAFLLTLTDSAFLNNPKFSAPDAINLRKAPVDTHQ